MQTQTQPTIELLESRIAPASIAITYADLDGDMVKITASKAGLVAPPLDLTDLTLTGGASGHLSLLNLTEAGFNTASVLFTVTKAANGDGLADVTRINGGTNNLGAIVVKGDLAEIDAGSGTAGTPAIGSLSVRSMGLYGNGNECDIVGSLGALTVTRDLKGAYVHITGNSFTVGPVIIGGSLVGGTSLNSGRIFADGNIGNVRIGGDVQGGAGENSGSIFSGGNVGTVTIGGSLLGGGGPVGSGPCLRSTDGCGENRGRCAGFSGQASGAIIANDDLPSLTVAGSLSAPKAGRAAESMPPAISGRCRSAAICKAAPGRAPGALRECRPIDSVQIGGSLAGGGGSRSGSILGAAKSARCESGTTWRVAAASCPAASTSDGKITSVNIVGSLAGGSGIASGRIGGDEIVAVAIGGDVVGGAADDSGALISTDSKLGNVTVRGSIVGGAGENSGKITSGFTTGIVKIGGSVVGGTGENSGAIDSAAFMVSVSVGGSLVGGTAGSGAISGGGDLNSVTIGRDVVGGGALDTGAIFAARHGARDRRRIRRGRRGHPQRGDFLVGTSRRRENRR